MLTLWVVDDFTVVLLLEMANVEMYTAAPHPPIK